MKSQQFCFDRPAVDLGSIACCPINLASNSTWL